MNQIAGTNEKMLELYLQGLYGSRGMMDPEDKQVICLPPDSTLSARQEFCHLLKNDGFWVWTTSPNEDIEKNTNLLSVFKAPEERKRKEPEHQWDLSGSHWMAQGEFLDFVCSTYGGTPWQHGQKDWKKLGEYSVMIWNGCLLKSGMIFLDREQTDNHLNIPVAPLNSLHCPVYIQEPIIRDFFLNQVIPLFYPHGREKESSYQAFLKRQEKRWDRHWKKAHPEWKKK